MHKWESLIEEHGLGAYRSSVFRFYDLFKESRGVTEEKFTNALKSALKYEHQDEVFKNLIRNIS